MKKISKTVTLMLVLLAFLGISIIQVSGVVVNATGGNENASVFGTVVSEKKTERTEDVIVTLPNSSKVRFASNDNKMSDTYIAIEMAVKSVQNASGDKWCPIQISVNDVLLTGDFLSGVNAVASSGGAPYLVERKWGDYYFLNPGFDGTLYISDVAAGTEISSVTITMGYTHSSVIAFRGIDTCSTIGGEKEELISLDFTTDANGNVTDERVSMTACQAVSIDNGMKFTFSRESWARMETATAVASETYIAIRMKVKYASNGAGDNWCPIHISINDVQLTGDFMSGVNAVASSGGDPYLVERKWGDYYFLNPGFNGTLYISDVVAGTEISSVTITMGYTHESEIEVYSIETTQNMDGSAGTQLIDVKTATLTGNMTILGRVENSWYEISDVYIPDNMFGGLKMSAKKEADGGTVIPTDADWLGRLDFTPETSFEAKEGLALTVAAITDECYFRIFLTDANGVTWQAQVTNNAPESADKFPFVTDGNEGELKGFYGAFYLTKGMKGTLYIGYDKFAPINSGAVVMGAIQKITVALDFHWGLGNSMMVNSFGNVDGENSTIDKIFVVSELTDADISLTSETKVGCSQSDTHKGNFVLARVGLDDFGNRTALSSAIEKCEAIDESKYTETSLGILNDKLAAAKTVYNNPDATQAEIDEAATALENAYSALEEKVTTDKTALSNAIEKCEAIDESKYTETSLGILNDKLAAAKTVYNNPDATQAEIDEAATALENAYSALEEKVVDDKPDDGKPSDDNDKRSGCGAALTGDVGVLFAIVIAVIIFLFARFGMLAKIKRTQK